jgi:6-phosphogluconolactonase/glucosamine-6-phosphate isomerase/deaminase
MAIAGELVVVEDVADAFATHLIEAFRTRPHDTFSLALSGGATARACYERVAETAGTQIDWWKVDVYWGDERCIPHDHEDSNYRLAREALLDRVGAANATHLMRCTEGPDRTSCAWATWAGSTWSTWGWAPTATPPRSSRAPPPSTPTPGAWWR